VADLQEAKLDLSSPKTACLDLDGVRGVSLGRAEIGIGLSAAGHVELDLLGVGSRRG
jgi:hypothetical protein